VLGLTDGQHSFVVRVSDAVGNEGKDVDWTFVVDTVRPFIDIAPPPALVNTSSVELRGKVEPGSTLTVSGLPFDVSSDGSVSAVLELVEGENALDVVAVDRAGNRNSTRFAVVSDTIEPALTVEDPPAWSWTKSREVTVDGTVEPGATVRVNGEEVAVAGVWFSHNLTLAQGTLLIVVMATDEAGNTARVEAVLLVDWTAPTLVIRTPRGGSLTTSEAQTYIEGLVDDPSVDHVTINGVSVATVQGSFVQLCELSEGANNFRVEAVDAAGNADAVIVAITRDTRPPTYSVDLVPVGGRLLTIGGTVYSTARAVDAHIVADETVVVEPAGNSSRPRGADVWVRFELEEGQNDIAFALRDLADNQGEAYGKRIVLDTTRPQITIVEPTPGLRTKSPDVVVFGRTEAGCNVTVAGTPVALLPLGEFRLVVALEEGKNDILVEAVDAMGNTNSTTVSVVREAEGPGTGGTATAALYIVLLVVLLAVVAAIAYAVRRRRD